MGPIGSNNSDPLFQSIRQSWDHLSSSCSGQEKKDSGKGKQSSPIFGHPLLCSSLFLFLFSPPLCGDREEATTNGFGRAGRGGHLLLGPSVVVVRPPGHREPSISREGEKALWGIISGGAGKAHCTGFARFGKTSRMLAYSCSLSHFPFQGSLQDGECVRNVYFAFDPLFLAGGGGRRGSPVPYLHRRRRCVVLVRGGDGNGPQTTASHAHGDSCKGNGCLSRSSLIQKALTAP